MDMTVIDKAVRDTVKRYKMFGRGDTVCVAVSGGVDSTVLLHSLFGLKHEFGIELVVCHLNHNLRGAESARDLKFVKATARRLGLRFEGRTLKKNELPIVGRGGGSLQERARGKRLEFFQEAVGKYSARRVALAHNLDDQAETVLMRFLKGAGPRGLAGMAPVRGVFIRPLLGVKRADIEAYARSFGVKYVRDSSNRKRKYLRNRLRLDLLPVLETYNPNIKDTLARSAAVMSRDAAFIRAEAERAWPGVVKKKGKSKIEFDRVALKAMDAALQARVFMKGAAYLLGEGGQYVPHVEAFLGIVKGRRPNASIDLPRLTVRREYDTVTIESIRAGGAGGAGGAGPAPPPRLKDKVLKVPGLTRIPGVGTLKASVLKTRPPFVAGAKRDPRTAWFDFDALEKPLKARGFTPGDRMRPLGMKGTKKLKDIFIDQKVPVRERPLVALLTSGGVIIWAVGVRQAEQGSVKRGSKRILKIELSRGR